MTVVNAYDLISAEAREFTPQQPLSQLIQSQD
ncbi:hypothetical protein J2Y88_002030 [Pseudomonas chlororaphis]|nr:hypothetical protein [Pseudomonas chlororaphis]MCP1593929.1 hypothetical protein [Pseudomonas chlororaphis]